MKFKPLLKFLLFTSITCVSHGAQLIFPVNFVSNYTQLDNTWSQSDGALAADKLAFYTVIPSGYDGVSVGAYADDYASVGSDFTIGHSLAYQSMSVADAYFNWGFSITAPTGDFGFELHDYSISINTSSVSDLTIDLTYAGGINYEVFANGTSFGFIQLDGYYKIDAAFGTSAGLDLSITGLIGSPINYNDALFDTSGTFTDLEIGTTLGAGNSSFSDSFITVVPEPGTSMLAALVPAFLIFRRRR